VEANPANIVIHVDSASAYNTVNRAMMLDRCTLTTHVAGVLLLLLVAFASSPAREQRAC
jgi:hypothetical protein